MIYKLSYRVAFDPTDVQKVYAGNEIELAYALLDMERDVGKICYDVKIEQIQRPSNFTRKDQGTCLRAIQHYAKILEKDLEE